MQETDRENTNDHAAIRGMVLKNTFFKNDLEYKKERADFKMIVTRN